MRQCKACVQPYNIWSARGDGLCPTCRSKLRSEWEKQAHSLRIQQESQANETILSLLNEIAPNTHWEAYGIGVWTIAGSEAAAFARRWLGRAVFGIWSDVLFNEDVTHYLSIVALSKSGLLYIVRIGEGQAITPETIAAAAVDPSTITAWPLSEVSCSYGEGMLVWPLVMDNLSTKMSFTMTFPSSVLPVNRSFPEILFSIRKAKGLRGVAYPMESGWLLSVTTISEAEAANMRDGQPFGGQNPLWRSMLCRMMEGDALWEYCSPKFVVEQGFGREGVALVRNGDIIDHVVTRMDNG